MPLTRDFRETVQRRAQRDPEFREMLLTSGVQCLLGGEASVAKVVLNDYIETAIGYKKLGKLTGRPPESLSRMFSGEGNASASDLLEVVNAIQRHEGICLEVRVVRQGVNGTNEPAHDEKHTPAPSPA